jgi:sugar lactone lactonase YvrE
MFVFAAKALATAGILTLSIAPASQALTVFATGLNGPRGLAFDNSGNLYISNSGPGGTTVSRVGSTGGNATEFANGLDIPEGLAFDSSGNLYIANNAGGVSMVGSSGGTATTVSTQPNDATDLAFDANGNLYISSYDDQEVFEIAKGTTTPTPLITGITGGPTGLAFDSNGNLYISDFYSGITNGGTILEVIKGSNTANVFATGLNMPEGLAFDNSGNLYVSNLYDPEFDTSSKGTISEVSANGGTAIPIITSGLSFPQGLAFRNGNLYIANYGINEVLVQSVSSTPVPFDFSPNFIILYTLGCFWVISSFRSWYRNSYTNVSSTDFKS